MTPRGRKHGPRNSQPISPPARGDLRRPSCSCQGGECHFLFTSHFLYIIFLLPSSHGLAIFAEEGASLGGP